MTEEFKMEIVIEECVSHSSIQEEITNTSPDNVVRLLISKYIPSTVKIEKVYLNDILIEPWAVVNTHTTIEDIHTIRFICSFK